jgi:lipoprotein-anchoring transpeptidase ErfK/SrfK
MSIVTLQEKFGLRPDDQLVIIDVSTQKLTLLHGKDTLGEWAISSSSLGTGNEQDSFKTPLGIHRIAEKIGEGSPSGTVFKGRKATGQLMQDIEADDLITSRILWLEGLEPGINKGPGIDTHQRYIYIHGTNEENKIGTPASKGCIRMRNADVIQLFELLKNGTLVSIEE